MGVTNITVKTFTLPLVSLLPIIVNIEKTVQAKLYHPNIFMIIASFLSSFFY